METSGDQEKSNHTDWERVIPLFKGSEIARVFYEFREWLGPGRSRSTPQEENVEPAAGPKSVMEATTPGEGDDRVNLPGEAGP